MKGSPLYSGPVDDLSSDELRALRNVRDGICISGTMHRRLEILHLIESGLDRWVLTGVGACRLALGEQRVPAITPIKLRIPQRQLSCKSLSRKLQSCNEARYGEVPVVDVLEVLLLLLFSASKTMPVATTPMPASQNRVEAAF
jgi:hypothetical protein